MNEQIAANTATNGFKSLATGVIGIGTPTTSAVLIWMDVVKGFLGIVSGALGIVVGVYCVIYWHRKLAWQKRKNEDFEEQPPNPA